MLKILSPLWANETSEKKAADNSLEKMKSEAATGINVTFAITPEENYFDKVTISLNSRSDDPDLFMSGAYQIWEYAVPGYVQESDPFVNDSNLTACWT